MYKNNQIKFWTLMLNSCLCDYSDANILAKGSISITGRGADQTASQPG